MKKFSMLKSKHLSDPKKLQFNELQFGVNYALPKGPSKKLQASVHDDTLIPDNFYFPYFGEHYDKLI